MRCDQPTHAVPSRPHANRQPRSSRRVMPLICGLLIACGATEFPNAMNLGLDGKLRPLAIVIDPPEAAPGETVTVTMSWVDREPAATRTRWQVALEYVTGLHDEVVERHPLSIAAPEPVDDGDGFFHQTFTFTIPPDTEALSPALDYLVPQPTLASAAALVLAHPADKLEIDGYLRALTPDQVNALEPASRAAVQRLADLFSCMIRFRATIDHANGTVDVTRSLTIRHSRRLGSANANANRVVAGVQLASIPGPNAIWSDDPAFQSTVQYTRLNATASEAHIPRGEDATYYVVLDVVPEHYSSPYTPDQQFSEYLEWRTYWYALDDPTSPFELVRDDAGDVTDLESVDQTIRIAIPTTSEPARFRVVSAPRDERPEWEQFQGAPGLDLVFVDVLFD